MSKPNHFPRLAKLSRCAKHLLHYELKTLRCNHFRQKPNRGGVHRAIRPVRQDQAVAYLRNCRVAVITRLGRLFPSRIAINIRLVFACFWSSYDQHVGPVPKQVQDYWSSNQPQSQSQLVGSLNIRFSDALWWRWRAAVNTDSRRPSFSWLVLSVQLLQLHGRQAVLVIFRRFLKHPQSLKERASWSWRKQV